VGTPTIASYAWSQVGGVALSLPNANASVTQVVLPNAAGTFIFKLQVMDTLSQIGEAQVFVNTEPPSAALGSATGGGGGADRWLWLILLVCVVTALVRKYYTKPPKTT
jgi:hypothetical protein